MIAAILDQPNERPIRVDQVADANAAVLDRRPLKAWGARTCFRDAGPDADGVEVVQIVQA